jgi:tetratricopeptide (TPR) repeat protein
VVGEALQRWPQDPALLILQVDVAALLGERRLMETAIEQAAGVDTTWSWVLRSRAWRVLGDAERAVDAARTALQREPHDLPALVALAEALATQAEEATEEGPMIAVAEQARDTAELAVAQAPRRDDGYRVLVRLYRSGGPLESADELRDVARSLLEVAPDSRLYAFLAAQESLLQRRFEQALDRLLNLYQSDRTDAESLSLAITAWSQMQRLEDAERWLEDQRSRWPGDPTLLEQWARVLLERGEAERVIEELDRVRAAEPANQTATRILETALRSVGRGSEALQLAEARLGARPAGIRREVGLAALYAGERMAEPALEHLRWITEHADDGSLEFLIPALTICAGLPGEPAERDELLLALARAAIDGHRDAPLQVYGAAFLALARMDRLADGLFDDLARRAMASAPGGSDASMRGAWQWRRLAQLLVDEGQPLAASRMCRARLFAVAPLDSAARSLLALVTLASDASAGDQAERSLRLLLDLDARDQLPALGEEPQPLDLLEALYEASTMYSIVGDGAGADRLLQEVLQRDGDHAMALNNLGYLRLESGAAGADPQVAEWILAAAALEPEDSNVMDTLGWLRYKQGWLEDRVPPVDAPGAAGSPLQNAGAISLIRRAISLDDDPSAEVLDHLGDALYRAGDHAGAVASWQQAIGVLEDPVRQQLIRQNYFLIQSRIWGLLVTDPQALYDRDYGAVLERVRAKVRSIEDGGEPEVAATFSELPDESQGT